MKMKKNLSLLLALFLALTLLTGCVSGAGTGSSSEKTSSEPSSSPSSEPPTSSQPALPTVALSMPLQGEAMQSTLSPHGYVDQNGVFHYSPSFIETLS